MRISVICLFCHRTVMKNSDFLKFQTKNSAMVKDVNIYISFAFFPRAHQESNRNKFYSFWGKLIQDIFELRKNFLQISKLWSKFSSYWKLDFWCKKMLFFVCKFKRLCFEYAQLDTINLMFIIDFQMLKSNCVASCKVRTLLQLDFFVSSLTIHNL